MTPTNSYRRASWLVGTLIVLLAFPVLASSPRMNLVDDLRVDEQEDRTAVTIHTTRRPTFTVFKLANPQRLFIDIVDADVSAVAPVMKIRNGVIGSISVLAYRSDAGEIGRIILTFDQAASYDIETVGTDIRVLVDGTERTTPDLRLKAVEAEAQKIQAALAREREILSQIKETRLQEEQLTATARNARAAEEALIGQVTRARAEADRLRTLAEREAADVSLELEGLKRSKSLEQEKIDALTRAVKAEQARKQALENERKEAERLKALVQAGIRHEEARLAAARAAANRADKERVAQDKATAATKRRDETARRIEQAQTTGDLKDIERLSAELVKREEALAGARAELATQKTALEEAQLAQAQAERKLTSARAEAREAEKARADAVAEALKQERARADALTQASERRSRSDQARARDELTQAREKAQAQLAALEARLASQREKVATAGKDAEVHAARLVLLKDELGSHRSALDALKRERRSLESERDLAAHRLTELRDEEVRLTRATSKAASEAEALSERITAARAQLADLQASGAAEADTLADRIASEQAHLARLKADGKAEATRLKSEIRSAEVRLKKLKRQGDADVEVLTAQLATAKHQLAGLKQENHRVSDALDRAQVKEARAKRLHQKQVKSWKRELTKVEKELKKRRKDLTKLRAQEKKAQARLARYSDGASTSKRAQKRAQKAQARLDALALKLDAERTALTALEDRARGQQASLEALARQTQDAQARLEAVSAQRVAEEARLAGLQAESKAQAQTHAQTLATDRAEVAALRARVDEERARLATLADQRAAVDSNQAAAPASAPRALVTDVAYQQDGREGAIRIALSGDVKHEVVRRGPQRVELRLSGAGIPRELERSLDTSEFTGPVKLVSSFRSADDPEVVRVVVDLKTEADHSLLTEGRDLVWRFASSRAASAATTPAPGVAGGGNTYPGRVPPGVTSFPGVVGAQLGDLLGGMVGGSGGATNPSGKETNPEMDAYMARRRKVKKKYRGKKINLTIKDADIQHVLTFLAKEGGVNIVAHADVQGVVTFHLENIPWDLALDMILKTHGFDYVKESGIYRVASAEAIQAEYEAELRRKETIEELKPLVVRFITVNYATPENLQEHIQTVLSKNGTVTVDTATSTVVVKDTEEHVQAAEDIVRRLDVQLPQVLIEARIVEASASFSMELGIQWGGNFTMSPALGNPTGLAFPAVVGLAGGADDTASPTGGLLGTSPNFAVNLPAPTGAGAGGALGLTLGSLGGAGNLSLRLSAAESAGKVKIVSAPKILTLDGEPASIRQGVSVPVPVVSANGVNTQFFNADLKLQVATNTSPDGNIRMDLEITKNEPNFGQTSANGAPTIETKEAKTSLLVRDGETTVIGGIFTRNTGTSEASVPFLSKIPILGWFFQNSRETDNRSELLIFITPRIANRRASVVQTSAAQ